MTALPDVAVWLFYAAATALATPLAVWAVDELRHRWGRTHSSYAVTKSLSALSSDEDERWDREGD